MKRDDVFPYEIFAKHSEEEGKMVRKKIHFVFWLLLIVTIVEVLIGAFLAHIPSMRSFIIHAFIILTIVKAFYIIGTFMHLEDEVPYFRLTILVPYILLMLYLIYILLFEGNMLRSIIHT